jgi:phosphoesterase RecJ-like protein
VSGNAETRQNGSGRAMLERIKEIVESGEKFLITSHVDPDGDAVGSVLAMHRVLRSLGKDSRVYLKDTIPYRYAFLPAPADLLHRMPEARYDAIFVLDCGNFFRIGEGYERLKEMGRIINIDHHNTNDAYGEINVVDEQASSTAEILYRLFELLAVPWTPEAAISIYTAILTDTGSFRYDSTTSQSFLICEKMLGYGVSPAYVSQMVYESHPKERFLLLGVVLGTLKTFDHDRVAMAHVTEEMFRQTGTSREHVDGFVEYIREIKGVEVAVMLREVAETRYKVSMRSKGSVDVSQVCSLFGGGGHRSAAGCHINGNVTEAEAKLMEALQLQ